LGKIELQGFGISIKGLDSDFDYQMTYSTEQWGQLIGFFQNKSINHPHQPTQLVDRVCVNFRKYLGNKNKTNGLQLEGIVSNKYVPMNEQRVEEII
jgi:hypothetical protein